MVASLSRLLTVLPAAGLFVFSCYIGGCQSATQVSGRRLIEHQAFIDFSGLKKDEAVEPVKTTLAAPRQWEVMPLQSNPLFTHQQWRSPSTHTGVGVVLAHLPLPLNPKTVVWFAKQRYARDRGDGKVLDEWTDPLGRSWFEAENNKYHFRGYVVVKGFDAWIIYFGYRNHYSPDLAEISLAARSAETAVPMIDDAASHPTTQPAH